MKESDVQQGRQDADDDRRRRDGEPLKLRACRRGPSSGTENRQAYCDDDLRVAGQELSKQLAIPYETAEAAVALVRSSEVGTRPRKASDARANAIAVPLMNRIMDDWPSAASVRDPGFGKAQMAALGRRFEAFNDKFGPLLEALTALRGEAFATSFLMELVKLSFTGERLTVADSL